jgi:hypothetical protein
MLPNLPDEASAPVPLDSSDEVAPKTAVRFAIFVLIVVFALNTTPLSAQSEASEDSSSTFANQRSNNQSELHIHPRFMNMITHWYAPWPTVTFDSYRLWDTNTRWSGLNPGPGQYDWTILDAWLSAGEQHGSAPLMTLAMTPLWASSDPNNPICHYGPGQCAPPNDLNADGSGSDQHWKDFITAIAQHVGKKITYWEIWNEPNNNFFWSGTAAQMARMAQDARSIIKSVNPHARLLNGGTSSMYWYGLDWWNSYAAAGGLQWADIIALHGTVSVYPAKCGVYPQAETFIEVMNNLHQVLAKYGEDTKPIWDTEASWGRTDLDCFTDQDLQAAFLARFFLLHRSESIRKFFWRGWIDGDGGIYTKEYGLNKAGVAYENLYDWIVGNNLTGPCTVDGTIWTCHLNGPNGFDAQAIWDTAETCQNGRCGTKPYTVGSQYVQYRMLDGSSQQINNNTVPIGAKPILVVN